MRAYGNNVEKIFTVNPGGKTEDIKISFEGAKGIGINDSGELEIITESGEIKFTKPYAYQDIDGKRIEIKSSFRTGNFIPQGSALKCYGFNVASYNKSYPLIIDPAFVYFTHIGGAKTDEAASIAIGQDGYIYVAGKTTSTDLSGTTGGTQAVYGGGKYDAFISKLNSGLTTLIQSTYLGGSSFDKTTSIAIDAEGNVYSAGITSSIDFPGVAGSFQPALAGGEMDAFVSKLNPDLKTLIQSTYFGGSDTDKAFSVAIDSDGNICVVGSTASSDFSGTEGSAQIDYGGGIFDGFVLKLDSSLETDKKADIISKKITIPKNVNRGRKIKIKCYVKNKGETNAPASKIDFYLSDDNNKSVDDSDDSIGRKKVKSPKIGKTRVVSLKWKVPKKLKKGKYYVKSVCDVKNIVEESNEDNNVGASKRIAVK